MFEEKEKAKPKITEILPNTKRTQELNAKKFAEEQKRKAEMEMEQRLQQEKDLQLKKLFEEKKKQKLQEEQKRKEEERKKQEEKQQISTLSGKFGQMIADLKQNQTALDYTLSGLDLHPAQIRILLKAVEKNMSLKGLNMSRKKLKDTEGIELAKALLKNFVLERLELEGNEFGPKTCIALAELIKNNNSLRVLDLENNNITNDGKDMSGIKALCESIRDSQTILCVNLTNCGIPDGDLLVELVKNNNTLISLEIEQNPKINIEQVKFIQDKIKENKRIYDEERLREFNERKLRSQEENLSEVQHLKVESRKMVQENINIRIEAMRQEKEEKWVKEQQEENNKLQKVFDKIKKEVFLASKKKKKKKK